jgi:phosphopantothenoylcysteine decarboxylase/phosphopantothenate--cysteine ligase
MVRSTSRWAKCPFQRRNNFSNATTSSHPVIPRWLVFFMNVLLAITGSISAYKTPWLVRDLRRAGHSVRIVMSTSATHFVAPLALESVSLQPVIVDPFDPTIQDRGSWHVHLARWADVMLIAPCSASTLARLANGLCDSAVMTVACSLPSTTPLLVAPAMDTDMWQHTAVQRNVQRIQHDGAIIIPPEEGELASGLQGAGRLAELATIVDAVSRAQTVNTTERTIPSATHPDGLAGARVVITAGPTHEAIDDVRYIGNHSTGTMGFALAEAARDRGALVTLIAGPVSLPTPLGVERIDVTSAREMYERTMEHADHDVAICAAAVADFMPVDRVAGKIKKDTLEPTEHTTLTLQRTPDILAALGAQKRTQQVLVGFALESTNLIDYATSKLERKNADMIVANLAGGLRSGFGTTDNTITIITRSAPPESFPPMPKAACANVILDAIERLLPTYAL